MRRALSTFIFKLLGCAIVLALLVLALEMVLRYCLFGMAGIVEYRNHSPLWNPRIMRRVEEEGVGYRLKRELKANLLSKPFSTNAAGYRGAMKGLDKVPGSFRLMVLGRSASMGMGVSDGKVYTDILEKNLIEAKKRPVDVINFSVSGYRWTQVIAQYRHHGKAYRPDLVMIPLAYGEIDLYTPRKLHLPKRTRFNFRRSVHQFHLYTLLRKSVRGWVRPWIKNDWKQRRFALHPERFITHGELIAEFAKKLKAEGIRVALVVLKRVENTSSRQLESEERALSAWCRENGLELLVDMEKSLRGKIGPANAIYLGNTHPDEKAHELFAQEITKALLKTSSIGGE